MTSTLWVLNELKDHINRGKEDFMFIQSSIQLLKMDLMFGEDLLNNKQASIILLYNDAFFLVEVILSKYPNNIFLNQTCRLFIDEMYKKFGAARVICNDNDL